MIRKTQRNFRRQVKTWPYNKHASVTYWHRELVLRETWWLLWIIPIYTHERIEATTI